MANFYQLKCIALITAFTSMLCGAQPIANGKIQDPHKLCIPATYLPSSRTVKIHNKLLGKTEFEFVSFLSGSSNSGYDAIVVYKTKNGFQCDYRRIKIDDLINKEGVIDDELIEKSTVYTKSRMIDEITVATLRKTLLNQVKKACYPTAEKAAAFNTPVLDDGSTQTVYVKGYKDDILNYFGAILQDDGNSSFCCSEIEFALILYVTRPDDANLSAVLSKVTKYISNVMEGKDPGPDPAYREAAKEPENVPTLEELLESQ